MRYMCRRLEECSSSMLLSLSFRSLSCRHHLPSVGALPECVERHSLTSSLRTHVTVSFCDDLISAYVTLFYIHRLHRLNPRWEDVGENRCILL